MNKNIEDLCYESEKRLEWFINGINKHGLTPKVFSKISTERICKIYNIEMSFFRKYTNTQQNNKRQSFSLERANHYLELANNARKYGGNSLSCKYAFKYRQAWRIYRNCHEIYCRSINIPFYKQ